MLGRIARTAYRVAPAVRISSVPAKINVAFARTLPGVTSRRFSTMDDEPEYVVDPDAFLDVEKVKVTYIRDVEKQQVYARFMSDPVKWDVKALADYYAMSEERAQAIVYLMHN
eukprot:gene16679-19766_t